MKKKFEHKSVPTGRAVCEVKLVEILDRIKKSALAGSQFEPFIPQIAKALGDLSRDDLIKVLVERDFGPVVAYYRQSPDIQSPTHPVPDRRPAPRQSNSPGSQFGGRFEDVEMVRVRLNIGRRDALSPAVLISLVNRSTRGPMLKIGRIRILDHETVFEVAVSGAQKMVQQLNQAVLEEKPIEAVFDSEASGEKPRHRPAHPRKNQK